MKITNYLYTIGLWCLIFLCSPASAVVIKVDFAGEVVQNFQNSQSSYWNFELGSYISDTWYLDISDPIYEGLFDGSTLSSSRLASGSRQAFVSAETHTLPLPSNSNTRVFDNDFMTLADQFYNTGLQQTQDVISIGNEVNLVDEGVRAEMHLIIASQFLDLVDLSDPSSLNFDITANQLEGANDTFSLSYRYSIHGVSRFFHNATVDLHRVSLSAVAVPEPNSLALLSMGLIGLGIARRRLQKK